MKEQLKRVEERYLQLETLLSMPETQAAPDIYCSYLKEYNGLTETVSLFREYTDCQKKQEEAYSLWSDGTTDKELRLLAWEEYEEYKSASEKLWEQLSVMLLPKDPLDGKDILIEIRGCAGGEEAALFAADLFRMYSMFAVSEGLSVELLNENPTELGGYKEVVFQVSGKTAYSLFKFESGVHRVQRVPKTESQGRIQTSTATVSVLPVVDEVDVQINPADITMETCKSSGAGGQHINKTESAVRLIHRPSGIVVECQEERSQYKNRDKAMKMLRAKLFDIKERERNEKIAGERKNQVGTGDRSERIRTYNFPQGRVTDHRVGVTSYTLERFLNGEIHDILDALLQADIAEKMKTKQE